MKRDPTQFGRNRDTVRQKGPDSTLLYETVKEGRTHPYAMRPSEETGLVPIL